MSSNPFLQPVENYQRDLEIVDSYLNDNARYLSLMTGDSFEQCLEFVKTQVRPDGAMPLQNPPVRILNKDENGDRKPMTVTWMGFLNRVKKQNLLLAPSLTAYMPETIRKSTHSEYIKEGVQNRKRVKHAQIEAEGAKEFEKALVLKGEQENLKINNNSYSGATVSSATILYYKSTHSALTSTCRVATSYSNANNEKFLMGNRHYYTPEITKANFVSLINNTDLDELDLAIKTFGMVYPTTDDIISMMLYSTQHYWQNRQYTEQIRLMVNGMTPIQRAAIMYVGDLYHMYKLNPTFIRRFLDDLSSVGDPSTAFEPGQVKEWMDQVNAGSGNDRVFVPDEYQSLDSDTQLLAKFLCYETVKGRNDKMLRKEAPEVFPQVWATGKAIIDTLQKYKLFIQAFLLTKNVPSSVHAFPSAYRRAAVISDTDSTMFTMQWWVEQFYGSVTFRPEAKRTVFSLVFLVSEVVMHILAIQSANMGVAKDKLRMLAMKNEYYFAVLALTTRSKHYFASQDALEGVMFEVARMERKGVGLRDSKVQAKIIAHGLDLMKRIIESVKAEQPIDLHAICTEVANVEREIINSLYTGQAEYLTSGQCKKLESYKSEDNDTFKKNLFWCEVFGPSYGMPDKPPYNFFKISLTANNRTQFEAWADSMQDPQLAMRLKNWSQRTGKTEVNAIHVPASVVENQGIPMEIARIADVRTVISNTMGVFYLVLESLGIFLSDGKNTRLLSDFY